MGFVVRMKFSVGRSRKGFLAGIVDSRNGVYPFRELLVGQGQYLKKMNAIRSSQFPLARVLSFSAVLVSVSVFPEPLPLPN
jgi:hypothetical protein